MNTLKVLIFTITICFSINLSAQSVYTTKTGEKYHKSSCKYLKYSKKEITLERAKHLGYSSCSVCKPIRNTGEEQKTSKNNFSPSKSKKPSGNTSKKAQATQCTGKTKSGSRCKRKTTNTNGRCYQH